MYLTSEKKTRGCFQKIMDGLNLLTTHGSPESPDCPLTHRIKHLTEHLKSNKKGIYSNQDLVY